MTAAYFLTMGLDYAEQNIVISFGTRSVLIIRLQYRTKNDRRLQNIKLASFFKNNCLIQIL